MNFKKHVFFILIIFLNIYLFSEEMSFRCTKAGIPEKAAGTYEINQNQQFIYHSPEGKTYNLLSRVDVTGLGITVRKISVRSYELFKYGKDFYTFDDNGNLYFLIEINFLKNGTLYNSSSGVVRFNPLTQKSTCLFAQEKTFPLSFCVSPDGSYLFYAFHSFENTTNYYGYSYVYAIPTKTPTQTEIIWEPYYDYPHIHGIRNLCFDENINALYFTVDARNDNENYGNGQGIYRLKADLNGKYKASNTERISCLTFWQLNNLIERTEITKDYKSLEKALKKHCGNFINPDDLEINLSYFKDVSTKLSNGKKYASLYKTDSNGNPLSEEEALKYLLKNRNLLNSFFNDYNISQNRSLRGTPLDTICFYKGTNTPAFNYNAYGNFYNTNASGLFGFLYSNKEGIWALFRDNDGLTASIFHLTDNKGNLLGTQENGLNTVKFQDLQNDFKPFFVYDNSLTWLDVSQKKIYHYENDYLTILVDNSKNNHKYSYEEVKKIADEYENKKKKNVAEINSSSTESKESAAQNLDNSMIQEITARLQNNQETIEALLSNQEKQFNSQNENNYQNQIIILSTENANLRTELNSKSDENSNLRTELDSISAENSTLRTKIEMVTADFQKNEQKRNLFFILFVVFTIVSIILLIILLANYSIQTRKLNEIKNNKKFIFDIQEAERAKISRDIHDSVIQDIRSIRIDTELIKTTDETEVRKEKVINTATQCVVKLRNICYNLTPAELMTHEQGDSSKIELISIIQSLVLQFIEKTHVPCQLKIDENFEYPVFSKEISQNLFRIVQEALNNIEKHSYATNCQIFIKNKTENNKKYMLIYISDDGIGCDIEQILKKHKKDHFGIQNMKDRAELIGASISFQSEQGQGMEIRIQI